MEDNVFTGQPRKNTDGSTLLLTTLPDWFRIHGYMKDGKPKYKIIISDVDGIVPFDVVPDYEYDFFRDALNNLMICIYNNYVLSLNFPEVKVYVHA